MMALTLLQVSVTERTVRMAMEVNTLFPLPTRRNPAMMLPQPRLWRSRKAMRVTMKTTLQVSTTAKMTSISM